MAYGCLDRLVNGYSSTFAVRGAGTPTLLPSHVLPESRARPKGNTDAGDRLMLSVGFTATGVFVRALCAPTDAERYDLLCGLLYRYALYSRAARRWHFAATCFVYVFRVFLNR